MVKKIALALVAILLLIQVFRPAKNLSGGTQPNAIQHQYPVPENVTATLKISCFDCHSNHTRYPWYAEVQPFAGFLAHHVNEGKEELNFDEFLTYPPKKQAHKLKEVAETVSEGEMPLGSFTLVHRDAILNEKQKSELIAWANQLRQQIQARQGN